MLHALFDASLSSWLLIKLSPPCIIVCLVFDGRHPVRPEHQVESRCLYELPVSRVRDTQQLASRDSNNDVQLRRESVALEDSLLHHKDILSGSGDPWLCHHNASAVSSGGIVLLMKQGDNFLILCSKVCCLLRRFCDLATMYCFSCGSIPSMKPSALQSHVASRISSVKFSVLPP